MADALSARHLRSGLIHVTSPGMWRDGPMHAAIALQAVRAAVERPGGSLTEPTIRFCAGAAFRRCHRHDVGRELDAIVRSPHAARGFRLLADLRLLRPLTEWGLRPSASLDDDSLASDVSAALHRIDAGMTPASYRHADAATVLRYAAWVTSIERSAAAPLGPPDLRAYMQARERALVTLTASREQGFRVAMTAVAYWRAEHAVAAGHDVEAAIDDCIRTFGPLKGGCAAALLLAVRGEPLWLARLAQPEELTV